MMPHRSASSGITNPEMVPVPRSTRCAEVPQLEGFYCYDPTACRCRHISRKPIQFGTADAALQNGAVIWSGGFPSDRDFNVAAAIGLPAILPILPGSAYVVHELDEFRREADFSSRPARLLRLN